MGRIRLAYPHRRSQVTARLGSFLLKVESGAERVMARALGRFRSTPPAAQPADLKAAEREPAAEPAPAGATPVDAAARGGAVDVGPGPAPSGALAGEANPRRERSPSRSFVPPSSASVAGPEPVQLSEPELPATYGCSRVVALAIDPYHVHVYWEITPADTQAARARLAGSGLTAPTWVLRFHDVTRGPADTAKAHGYFDIEIDLASRNWYVELWSPDKTYLVELGARLDAEFGAVCQANPVTVPAAELSPPREPEWRIADPERGTTEGVAASDPRLPRAAGAASIPETVRSEASGSAFDFDAEQPWVAASRGLGADEAKRVIVAESPASSEAPATRAATPHALSLEPRSQRGSDDGVSRTSRSVSLPGLASGSGGSRIQGGDSNE